MLQSKNLSNWRKFTYAYEDLWFSKLAAYMPIRIMDGRHDKHDIVFFYLPGGSLAGDTSCINKRLPQ